MKDPDLDFQQTEEEDLWESLRELVIIALLLGAEGGMRQLAPELRSGANWTMFDTAAQQFLTTYRVQVLAPISSTSIKLLREVIYEWRREGTNDLSILFDRMRTAVYSEDRALLIAITEITRLFSVGSELIWATLGYILQKEWHTARDDRVCPICAPMHGRRASILTSFDAPGPPAHPRCRCWTKPVLRFF